MNEKFAVSLAGNPTTGYEWQASVDPNYVSPEAQVFEPRGKAVGAGGRAVFRFTALRVGQTEITFKYQRAWESVPLKTKRCRLVIVD